MIHQKKEKEIKILDAITGIPEANPSQDVYMK